MYGSWTVIDDSVVRLNGRKAVLCSCSCGQTTRLVLITMLATGRTVRCHNCRRLTIKHGHALNGVASKAYSAWLNMKHRCSGKDAITDRSYIDRGIDVCDAWKNSFETFLSDMGEPAHGMQLDRINNDGNYEPGNCRWATVKDNVRNSRQTKLNTEVVKVIRFMQGKVRSITLARLFKVSQTRIYSIWNKVSWVD